MRTPNIIPKEQMTPYQRWEMASLEESGSEPSAHATHASHAPAAPAEAPPAPPAGPTPAEIAAIHEEARQLGFSQGLELGRATGYEEGHAAGIAQGRVEMGEIMQHFRHVAATFSTEVAHCSENIAPELLGLALDLTKAIIKTSLAVRPELVLPVVSAALQAIPTLQQPALLHLGTEDAALIRDHMGPDLLQLGWRIVEDADIERGGCRIETASNHIDATLPARWQRLATSLSRESDWLMP